MSSLASAPKLKPRSRSISRRTRGDAPERSRTSSAWIRSGSARSPPASSLPPAQTQASRYVPRYPHRARRTLLRRPPALPPQASRPPTGSCGWLPDPPPRTHSGPGWREGKHSLVQAPLGAERMINWERCVVVIEDGPATAAAAARRRMLIGIDMLVAGGPPRVLPGPKNEVTGFASAIVFELVLGKPATRA
ncbi:hypothetical protein DFH11DRAFT_123988 [Phellopilus nigrolimitatus]|nr:hypothetical protein DFH11DRAFT_123988 [Phellopilus nigrolimitatus]